MSRGLNTRPLGAALGIEIVDVDLKRLNQSQMADIENCFDSTSALLIRGQTLSPEDLVAFSRRLGDLDEAPVNEAGKTVVAGLPELYVVSNIKDANGVPIGSLGAGEAVWHTDMSYLENPPDASLLYALEVPAEGGDTWVARMVAALVGMDPALRARIEGRRIKHDGTYNSGGYLRQGVEATDDPLKAPGAYHPAICRHPRTGHEALYLGRRRNAWVEGLERAESEALLDEVWAHATRPEYCYMHRWRVGDVLIWDNRATLHRRDPFDPAARRLMHRTQVRGKAAPVGA
ncbi:MAG TPA: TauD/TfdA family dioxygenase [Thermohalobaculum sp.]|nr:TauD/TfdA family dioxygenase [Thermohalobaculum sp.]